MLNLLGDHTGDGINSGQLSLSRVMTALWSYSSVTWRVVSISTGKRYLFQCYDEVCLWYCHLSTVHWVLSSYMNMCTSCCGDNLMMSMFWISTFTSCFALKLQSCLFTCLYSPRYGILACRIVPSVSTIGYKPVWTWDLIPKFISMCGHIT